MKKGAENKDRDAFPEVSDDKVTIGDNLDGGMLSMSDIYSPKEEPVLLDNVLDPTDKLIKEIVIMIDGINKSAAKKSDESSIIDGIDTYLSGS